MVSEAGSAGIAIVEMYVRQGHDAPAIDGITTYELDPRTYNSVSDTDSPQGVMALCEMPASTPRPISGSEWVLVLHDVADPGNMGTLARSAEAAGATAVVLIGSTVDPWSPKVIRASAGAIFHVPVWRVESLGDLRALGAKVVGTTSHPEGANGPCQSLHDADLGGAVAIVLGNEAHGLDPDADVDLWLTIPHEGRAESLNVAMAGTVIAMHVAHLRRGLRG